MTSPIPSSSSSASSTSVADLRKDYRASTLDESNASHDPFEQFERWWQDTLDADIPEPNGMTLATVGAEGRPSARIVLLKGFDRRGFQFFTNYNSRKGQELAHHPYAALVFWWEPLERQVRIEGTIERLPPDESDAYFRSRPKGSRLGAWASPQSQVIAGRHVLEAQQAQLEAQYKDTEEIARPAHWGGFRVVPDRIEFWQGRSSRLHDRLCYIKAESAESAESGAGQSPNSQPLTHWRRVRLAP